MGASKPSRYKTISSFIQNPILKVVLQYDYYISGKCIKKFTLGQIYHILIVKNMMIIAYWKYEFIYDRKDILAIYDLVTYNRIILEKNRKKIIHLNTYQNKVLSVREDGIINFWDYKGIYRGSLNLSPFTQITVYRNLIYTRSHKIQVWDGKNQKCLIDEPSSCMILNEDILIVGMINGDIYMGDKILKGHTSQICELSIINNHLISVCVDNIIRIWDKEECIAIYDFPCMGKIRIINGPQVLSYICDRFLGIWNLNGNLQFTSSKEVSYFLSKDKLLLGYTNGDIEIDKISLKGHTGEITCLKTYENKIISCSYDGTLRIWE